METMVLLMGLERMGVAVSFCWVPTHVGVEGRGRPIMMFQHRYRLLEDQKGRYRLIESVNPPFPGRH
jgi:hypothetical protein